MAESTWNTFKEHARRIPHVYEVADGSFVYRTKEVHRRVYRDPVSNMVLLETHDPQYGHASRGYLSMSPWAWIKALAPNDTLL